MISRVSSEIMVKDDMDPLDASMPNPPVSLCPWGKALQGSQNVSPLSRYGQRSKCQNSKWKRLLGKQLKPTTAWVETLS